MMNSIKLYITLRKIFRNFLVIGLVTIMNILLLGRKGGKKFKI